MLPAADGHAPATRVRGHAGKSTPAFGGNRHRGENATAGVNLRAHRSRATGLDRSPATAVPLFREYGWGRALRKDIVAGVVADSSPTRFPAREMLRSPSSNGEIVGSIFVVAKTKTVFAKLRPAARRAGRRAASESVSALVDDVIRCDSRKDGYKNDRGSGGPNRERLSARKIYKAAGIRVIGRRRHQLFGRRLTAAPGQWRCS